jgi:ribokinase
MVCENGQVTVCPAPPVTVVDTTGAGDCFVGALADALARGRSLPDALHWAVAAASLSTQSLGATTAMPTSAEVEALLARSNGQSRP